VDSQATRGARARATKLIVSWNCRNLRMLLNTARPHSTDLTMLLKLSSMITMSAAALATSVPARMQGQGVPAARRATTQQSPPPGTLMIAWACVSGLAALSCGAAGAAGAEAGRAAAPGAAGRAPGAHR